MRRRCDPLTRSPRGALVRCALGVVVAALAIELQLLITRATVSSPFLLVYPAVVLVAWWGCWEAGVAAIGTSLLGLIYFLLPPTTTFEIAMKRDAVDLGLFAVISGLLVYFVDRTKKALQQAEVARHVAEQATAARDAMIAIVAHDLRNPMQTVGLNVELIAANLAPDDDRARIPLDRLRRAAARAARLVDNIVDGGHIGGEPFPLKKAQWPLAVIVEDALSVFEPVAASRGLKLTRPPPEALGGTVFCDRDRIAQVLSNLLGNALQYTPRGGAVTLAVEQTPEGTRFEVSDTGPGMSEDELSHAFERLWHGPGPGHGSGLGLWIAEALTEAHGARITPKSAVGKGTSMAFVLPPHRAPATGIEASRVAPAYT